MGGFIKIDAERVETTALNTKINKEMFDKFKAYCKTLGYPMNVLLETFMQQYANERFDIKPEDVLKWKNDKSSEVDTLNTTFNKEIYLAFKSRCKENKFFVKHVILAFMEKYSSQEYVMEFVKIEE